MFINKIWCWQGDLVSTVICVNLIEVKEFEDNVNLIVFWSVKLILVRNIKLKIYDELHISILGTK